MRLLLLALTILAFLPQVAPAYRGEKKCSNKSGHCRKKCQDGELTRDVCRNHRVCCIAAKYGFRIRKVTQKTTPIFFDYSLLTTSTILVDDIYPTSPTTFYDDVHVNPTEFYDITVPTITIPITQDLEGDKENDNGEKPGQKHDTETPVPEIHHSSW